ATELEQAERAERVEAFFESEVDERLQYIRGNLDPDLAQGEAVALDHVRDDARVARLLERLKLERRAHGGVRLQRGARADHRAGVLLGLERVRPEGKAA